MRNLFVPFVVLVLTGCATTPRGADLVPLVDMRGKSEAAFASDLSDCRGYAAARMTAVRGAVLGAIAGALIGGAVAPRGYRNYSASNGAVLGTAAGAAHANDTQESIIKRCMAGRGYNVLD